MLNSPNKLYVHIPLRIFIELHYMVCGKKHLDRHTTHLVQCIQRAQKLLTHTSRGGNHKA
jgi:hypothetical protein